MRSTSAEIISEGKRISELRADWWISGAFHCQGAARLGGVGRDELDRKSYTFFCQKPMGIETHSMSIRNSGETERLLQNVSIQWTLLMQTK